MVIIDEDVGLRELCVRLFSGILMRDVIVNVQYEDNTALGKWDHHRPVQ